MSERDRKAEPLRIVGYWEPGRETFFVNDNSHVDRWDRVALVDLRQVEGKLKESESSVAGLVEALEECAGGDLASGEGIYKAEIARAALSSYRAKRGE